MAFTYIFQSDDTGAPQVSNVLNELITALGMILGTTGYNSTVPTILSRVGTLVTVTDTAHGRKSNDIITVTGANESGFNGDFKITWIDANSYSYVSAISGTTTATGTFSAKKKGLGWTPSFTGTNRAAWITPNIGKYVEFFENAATTFQITGWGAMTASNTGTNSITSAGSQTKATTGDSCWALVSDGKFCYLFTSASLMSGGFSLASFNVAVFGEYDHVNPSAINNLMVGHQSSASASPFMVAIAGTALKCLNRADDTITLPLVSLRLPVSLYSGNLYVFAPTASQSFYASPDFETNGEVFFKPTVIDVGVKSVLGEWPLLLVATQDLLTQYGNLATIPFVGGNLAGKSGYLIKANLQTTTAFLVFRID